MDIRHWERSPASEGSVPVGDGILIRTSIRGDVQLGPSIELDKPAGLQGKELEMKEQALLKGTQNPF